MGAPGIATLWPLSCHRHLRVKAGAQFRGRRCQEAGPPFPRLWQEAPHCSPLGLPASWQRVPQGTLHSVWTSLSHWFQNKCLSVLFHVPSSFPQNSPFVDCYYSWPSKPSFSLLWSGLTTGLYLWTEAWLLFPTVPTSKRLPEAPESLWLVEAVAAAAGRLLAGQTAFPWQLLVQPPGFLPPASSSPAASKQKLV